MFKIEKITVQKRNKERYNIFLNENGKIDYAFSVDEATLIKYFLKKGKILTEKEIEEIKEYDSTHLAYQQAIQYLSYRMRSEKEIVQYLKKKDIPNIHIEHVILRLKKEKLIDDLEFAKMYTRTRINTTEKGPRFVRLELQQKGVLDLYIDEALEYFTFNIQYEKAKKLSEKLLNRRKHDSYNDKRNRIYQLLKNHGFMNEIIENIIEELLENDHCVKKEEKKALFYQLERTYRRYSRRFKNKELIYKIKQALYRRGFNIDLINEVMEDYQPLQKHFNNE